MAKRIKVCLELPGDTIFEQVYDDYSGRVLYTTVEADLTLGEINCCLQELESAFKEMIWEETGEHND